jgi:hypothetical protein
MHILKNCQQCAVLAKGLAEHDHASLSHGDAATWTVSNPYGLQVLMRHMESLEEEGPHVTSLPFHLRLIRPGAEVSKGLARRCVWSWCSRMNRTPQLLSACVSARGGRTLIAERQDLSASWRLCHFNRTGNPQPCTACWEFGLLLTVRRISNGLHASWGWRSRVGIKYGVVLPLLALQSIFHLPLSPAHFAETTEIVPSGDTCETWHGHGLH